MTSVDENEFDYHNIEKVKESDLLALYQLVYKK